MQIMEEKKTQKQRLKDELEAIRVDVTEGDRNAYRQAHPVSTVVLSNYLNGKAASVDTGMKMLLFFRERIEEREKLLDGQVATQ